MKALITLCIVILLCETTFARMDSSFYTSTMGEMQYDLTVRESYGRTDLKANTNISPIGVGIGGDLALNVAPFLSFSAGSQLGAGWNYNLFGMLPLKGLGLNKKTNADDPDDDIIGHGLDGIVYNIHAGNTLQFDFAAIFPSDWNHVIFQIYNEINYFAYTKAKGDALWYYQGDEGMNQNTFNHKFSSFIGYAMPVDIDLVGIEFSGRLPFYNAEMGSGKVKDIGYKTELSFLANYKINEQWSLMTIVKFANGLEDPITSRYKREWGFDRVQFIFSWKM